jgi:hypothetical protein
VVRPRNGWQSKTGRGRGRQLYTFTCLIAPSADEWDFFVRGIGGGAAEGMHAVPVEDTGGGAARGTGVRFGQVVWSNSGCDQASVRHVHARGLHATRSNTMPLHAVAWSPIFCITSWVPIPTAMTHLCYLLPPGEQGWTSRSLSLLWLPACCPFWKMSLSASHERPRIWLPQRE